jgi:hypothetical protein
MLQFIRQIFKKKSKPLKTIEIIDDLEDNSPKMHNFQEFTDKKYCTILERVNSKSDCSYDTLKIAWRCQNRIKPGDLIILNRNGNFKTLRLLKILKEDPDEKIGIVSTLK